MKRVLVFIVICCSIVSVIAQQKQVYKNDSIQTADLYSPMSSSRDNGSFDASKSCLNLNEGNGRCDIRYSIIRFGLLRVGEDWDWMQISMPSTAQTRIVSLGSMKWEDAIRLPTIAPWAKLKPGEQRSVHINASGANGRPGRRGADGAHGTDGISAATSEIVRGTINFDGTAGDRTLPVSEPATPELSGAAKSRPVSTADPLTGYDPYQKAIAGNMYLVRVVDETNDYYVLLRVDKIDRGNSCKISWRKVELPDGQAAKK